MDIYKRRKKSSRQKPKHWDEGPFYEERLSRNDLADSRFEYQEEFERGLAIASLCSPQKSRDSYQNFPEPHFQAPAEPPEWVQPSCSSFGGPPQPRDNHHYSNSGLLPPPPLPPSLPPSAGDRFYPPFGFSTQVYEKPPLEDRLAFPSFRFMKIKRRVKIFSADQRNPLNYLQLEALAKEILERILTAEGRQFKPRFYGLEIRNGCLETICGDETTLFWLKKLIQELTHPDGIVLQLTEENEEGKMFLAEGYFSNSQDDSNERILRFLENQNEGLDVSRWQVFERLNKRNGCVRMSFLIDFSSLELMKRRGERLSYKFGVVRLMLKSKTGERLTDDDVNDEPDFPQPVTQYPNPAAFPPANPHEMSFQPLNNAIPSVLTNYLEEYKTRISEMMENSRKALLRGLYQRKPYLASIKKAKMNKKKKKKKVKKEPDDDEVKRTFS